ncbi:Protein of unknown function DUF115 [Geoalkalibacter ferrihydriticus]|uniref:6-hydroxymethylpterin diphosphokinase MptE-like domain-containing protein n=2 Tax=Geoalkalibacter ferrihydriticus TaxID=392333 RepID=A0A0C2HRM1_9BACT|nr:6-hydroxymethylpterin diphosphokinase MptE-like protein [Geoalkalibacter ferrihydriticus]KIH77495.1 hypothetical protein GFER_01940 [Geoalkalibacter ferrihydriticus DSM 17813]SDL64372.1 Protein of unknown function DUF115 [Geoalkalibacter ferrihydriticus]
MSTSGTQGLGPFLTNRFGDRYLYEVNRSVFDQVGSAAVYQKYFGEDFFKPNHLYIVVGTDSGVLLRHVKKRPLADGARYLFVELPSVVEALRAEGDLEDLPRHIQVVSLENLWAQAEAFQLQNYLFLSAVKLRDSMAAMDANLTEYRDLSDHLREQFQAMEWATRGGLGCRDFVVRQLENLGENRIPAIHLKGKFTGKTAVILGGGPSLDEILPWVKEHQDEIAILAVSRVSRRLQEFGLVPHFVFSVDPHDVSFDVSREMLHFWEKTLFVNSYHVSPKLLGQWRGRSVYVGDLFPWAGGANPPNLHAPGPTVTNTALSVAIDMGFSQIVLAGVDLCYSKSGITHAKGSFESEIGPRLNNILTVETNGGWRAETGPDYHKAIEVLDQQAAIALNAGCQVINSALGAAKMSNVKFAPVEEITLNPFERPIFSELLEILPVDSSQERLVHYHLVRKELERTKLQLEIIKELSGEALYCNKGLFGKIGKKANYQYKRRMDEIESRLNSEFEDLILLVKKFGILEFLNVTRLSDEKDWTDKEIEETADIYYGAYKNSATRLIGLINVALERIDTRQTEENSNPSLEVMSEIWRRDSQPGRVNIWLDRYADQAEVIAFYQKLIDALIFEFDSMLNKTDLDSKIKLREALSLAPVRGKVLRLFRSKNTEGLRGVIESLEGHSDQEVAGSLCALAKGYLDEIEQDLSSALAHYQELIGEHFTPITEDALKRIASISLKNGQIDFAKLALECLASAVFIYKSQYADLLKTLGEHQAAADLYVDYLERAPSDLSVLLKLGQLYRTMGAEDAARQVFEMVLGQDPVNAAAAKFLTEGTSQC